MFKEMPAYTISLFVSAFLHFTYVLEGEGQKYSIQLQHHTKPSWAFPWSWRTAENNFTSNFIKHETEESQWNRTEK